MTREEAKTVFLNRGYIELDGGSYFDGNKWRESIVVISEWLKEEPCEDAVSREEVAEVLLKYAHSTEGKAFAEFLVSQINALPPVTPKQRTGKWIDDKCSVCGKGIEDLISSPEWYRNEEPNFCPYCGVKLEGE